jgi:hypothetical protein
VNTIDDLIDTEVAAIKTVVDAIQAKTDNLPSDPADASVIAGLITAVDDFVDTEVAAIKAVTDKLDTAVELDGAVYRFTTNALEQAPTGGGGGGDATAANQATIIAALGVIDDFLDTEVAAIKTKTDNLPSDPADASDIAALLTAIDDFVDTEVAAIKAKTDQLTFTVANKVDATATVDVDEEAIADEIAEALDIPTVAEIAEGLAGSPLTVVSARRGRNMEVFAGVEYSTANGSDEDFDFTDLPDLTGASAAARMRVHLPGQTAVPLGTLTIVDAGETTQTLRWTATEAETATLVPPKQYVYTLEYKTHTATGYSVAMTGALIAFRR